MTTAVEPYNCQTIDRQLNFFTQFLLPLIGPVMVEAPFPVVQKCPACEGRQGGPCTGASIVIKESRPWRFKPVELRSGQWVVPEISGNTKRSGGDWTDTEKHSAHLKLVAYPDVHETVLLHCQVDIAVETDGPRKISEPRFHVHCLTKGQLPNPVNFDPSVRELRMPTVALDVVQLAELVVHTWFPEHWKKWAMRADVRKLIRQSEMAYTFASLISAWEGYERYQLQGGDATFLSFASVGPG